MKKKPSPADKRLVAFSRRADRAYLALVAWQERRKMPTKDLMGACALVFLRAHAISGRENREVMIRLMEKLQDDMKARDTYWRVEVVPRPARKADPTRPPRARRR